MKSVMKGNPKKVQEIANRRSHYGGGGGGGRQRANTTNSSDGIGERKVALTSSKSVTEGRTDLRLKGRAERLRQLKQKKK